MSVAYHMHRSRRLPPAVTAKWEPGFMCCAWFFLRFSSGQTYCMLTTIRGEGNFTPKNSHTSLAKIFLYSKKNPSKIRKNRFVLKKSRTVSLMSEMLLDER